MVFHAVTFRTDGCHSGSLHAATAVAKKDTICPGPIKNNMKFGAILLTWVSRPLKERNIKPLLIILGIFAVMLATYSTLFHVLMEWEGQNHSWFTSVYWTLVTMSTLGYGDIIFRSSLGQAFSVVVLLSGSLFVLVLLPYSFTQFIFIPWVERQNNERAPKKIDEKITDHIIMTRLGAIEEDLIQRLQKHEIPYVIIEPSIQEAVKIHEQGFTVMVGDLDDPKTYLAANVQKASLIFTSHLDPINANICFTAREHTDAKIVATANHHKSSDILKLAGANQVIHLGDMLGSVFSSRILSPTGTARITYQKDDLCIAEATVTSNKLSNKTIQETQIRQLTGCSIIAKWNHGKIQTVSPQTKLEEGDIILISGTPKQLDTYNQEYIETLEQKRESYIIILGGGRVGRSLSRHLTKAKLHHSTIDISADNLQKIESPFNQTICGDAADFTTLEKAGLKKATAVVITTHDDNINTYLTLYIDKLLDNIEILSRSHLHRNTSTLYRAGADMVLSYASTGADAVWDIIQPNSRIVISEGLEVFEREIKQEWAGKTILEIADEMNENHIIVGCTNEEGRISGVNHEHKFQQKEIIWILGEDNINPTGI